jgi:transketolase
VIIDRNRLSVTTRIDDDSIYSEIGSKITKFGWNFIEINGHNHSEISASLINAKLSPKPTLIMANTIKGKGVSFMENNSIWHHTRPTQNQFEKAINELKTNIERIK